MESNAGASLMIMYENESVDIRYGNGAQLQLSPCGCEFILVKPTDPTGHPLQTTERIRQRTRFAISTYKEMMVAALVFRNKYASRPYLPEELIPAGLKKPFFSIDSDVRWPEWSSCNAEFGPNGETTIRSEEGRAALKLSPSGEEFSVKFMCSLSRTQNQYHGVGGRHLTGQTADDQTTEVHQGSGSRRNESMRSRSCSLQIANTARPKPEQTYQSTEVVQHHSCCSAALIWRYPLSLAHHLRKSSRHSKPEDVRVEGETYVAQAHRKTDMSDVERQSHLPLALPLACQSPHWHRWKVTDPLANEEHSHQDFSTDLVKILWCHGVTYRILSGPVSVVEVSPGDGSVIRSDGIRNTYFTHHKPELLSGLLNVKEVTYHLNSLPPDVPGQLYSVCSVVSRASRILTGYNEAKQSLKLPATPSCLQESGRFCERETEENLSHPVFVEKRANVTRTAESRSHLVAAELEKIKRFNFLLDNTHLLRREKPSVGVESDSEGEVTQEAVNDNCIADALQRTSKAIQDIDALISAATLT